MATTESSYTEIGAFDAKTKLSEILRKVRQGERFTITVRGEAVADVVPSEAKTVSFHAPRRIFSAEEREAAYQRLMHPRITGVSHEEIRAAIEEGRQ